MVSYFVEGTSGTFAPRAACFASRGLLAAHMFRFGTLVHRTPGQVTLYTHNIWGTMCIIVCDLVFDHCAATPPPPPLPLLPILGTGPYD